jgi:hypothetical protein
MSFSIHLDTLDACCMLEQQLSDSPQSRELRRSSETRVQNTEGVPKKLKLIQEAACAKLFPVVVICDGCNPRANKSK